MAPVGHAATQLPAPWQRNGSTLTTSSAEVMAWVGQASMHRLHPFRPLRLWAQMSGS